MSGFSIDTMKRILARHEEYGQIACAVETGTAQAVTTMQLRTVFPEVYTVELSQELYEEVRQEFEQHAIAPDRKPKQKRPSPDWTARFNDSQVHFHQGDSVKLLPKLIKKLEQPVVWYLDAHYCEGYGGRTATESPCPLLEELKLLRKRPYCDIIIVDDLHIFGAKRTGLMAGWEEVTRESIQDALDEERIVEANPFGDQYVVYREAGVPTKRRRKAATSAKGG